MIRGTPHPDFEKCRNEGYIQWPEHFDPDPEGSTGTRKRGNVRENVLMFIIIKILLSMKISQLL